MTDLLTASETRKTNLKKLHGNLSDATWQVSYFGNTCELATGQSEERLSSFLRSIMRCPRAVYCTIPCRRRKL